MELLEIQRLRALKIFLKKDKKKLEDVCETTTQRLSHIMNGRVQNVSSTIISNAVKNIKGLNPAWFFIENEPMLLEEKESVSLSEKAKNELIKQLLEENEQLKEMIINNQKNK